MNDNKYCDDKAINGLLVQFERTAGGAVRRARHAPRPAQERVLQLHRRRVYVLLSSPMQGRGRGFCFTLTPYSPSLRYSTPRAILQRAAPRLWSDPRRQERYRSSKSVGRSFLGLPNFLPSVCRCNIRSRSICAVLDKIARMRSEIKVSRMS